MSEVASTPYPSATLELPVAWEGIRHLLGRCLELAHADALPASLLLVGEPGVGREALAVEMAAALTCRRQPRLPCHCSSCDRVRRGVHPDVHLLQARSAARRGGDNRGGEDSGPGKVAIGIDEVRALIASLDRHPYEGVRRVVVLDWVHSPPLGVEAAVALLKSLEEPPPKVVFLALAANPRHVLPTIVSRTVQVRVPPPTAEEAASLLAAITGVPVQQAQERLAEVGGDLGYALHLPVGEILDLTKVAAAAVAGDGAALGALARRLKHSGSSESVVAALVETLRRTRGADAESLLAAAAALLTSQRLAASLNVGLDQIAAGRLALLR